MKRLDISDRLGPKKKSWKEPVSRIPEKNPDSEFNKLYLVTVHSGGMGFVVYHGNNINIAEQTFNLQKLRKRTKNNSPRLVFKLWGLLNKAIQAKDLTDANLLT